MMKVRLIPSRNLGCIGLYGESWAVDVFRRPYLGMFIRLGRHRAWVHVLAFRIRIARRS
jgi:hypothetical protein